MRVRFIADFPFIPPERPMCALLFRAGFEGTVRRVCGVAAIAKGRAVEVPGPIMREGEGCGRRQPA